MPAVSDTKVRGTLRVYLGAAPGVGKTFAMLDEGNRRRNRGTDVVVGLVEAHGRPQTIAAIGELEIIPRRTITYRDAEFEEMDVDAVIARHPDLVLVDELAHTNVPGSRNEKRWQDIEEILGAGIDVLSTLNVQHLESINDVVQTVTGTPQRETVPDAMVRQAEQIQLVDQTPQALRRRMAHGNIYAADKVDAALSNYFREGNLTALRELALLWVADRVDEGLQKYRTDHDIGQRWETRERVVVALSGRAGDSSLVRRAARIADRAGGAELSAVHISGSDGLRGADTTVLASQRALVESLGGTYHFVRGDNPAHALVDFAKAVNATQLVLGASRRPQLRARLIGPGVGAQLVQLSGDIDVHIVPHERTGSAKRLKAPEWLRSLWPDLRHGVVGSIGAALALLFVTLALTSHRSALNLTSAALIYLIGVIVIALSAGLVVAVCAAVAASVLLNYYLTPPTHRFAVDDPNNALALLVFVVAAITVSGLVERAERRLREAKHATAEAQTLATVAGNVLRGASALQDLLAHLAEIYQMRDVSILERKDGQWQVARAVGLNPPTTPDDADVFVPADDSHALAMHGPVLAAQEQRVLRAFAIQAAAALRTERLAEEAQQNRPLRELDRTRTALLAAVSHDLRTPLAGAKAAVSSLREATVTFSADDQAELLATADESLDKLAQLVSNLLDMSRLQAGAMLAHSVDVAVEDVIASALDVLGADPAAVSISIPLTLPEVKADPGLLERVIGNLVDNALRTCAQVDSPIRQPPLISASAYKNKVQIRVIDHGPGLSWSAKESAFHPFQRFGDTSNVTGVGLGLALARGFTEAMDGSLDPEDTPGGGLTMVITLPAADNQETAVPDAPVSPSSTTKKAT